VTDKLNDIVTVGGAVAANVVSGGYSWFQFSQDALSFLTIFMNFCVAVIGLYIVLRRQRAAREDEE
jgi:uncharacterized phage infection (PIP) family protein YhgE